MQHEQRAESPERGSSTQRSSEQAIACSRRVAMDADSVERAVALAEVRGDDILPLVNSFFSRITEDQWSLLKSGSPDHATKIMLAELLLDIIKIVSNLILKSLNRTFRGEVSQEHVMQTLGDAITESFALAMHVSEEVTCASSASLTKLIAEQVTSSINASIPHLGSPEHYVPPLIVPPGKLNAMVGHARKFIKTVGRKLQRLCTLPGLYLRKQQPDVSGKTQSELSVQTPDKVSRKSKSELSVRSQGKLSNRTQSDVSVRSQGKASNRTQSDVSVRSQGKASNRTQSDVSVQSQGKLSDKSRTDVCVKITRAGSYLSAQTVSSKDDDHKSEDALVRDDRTPEKMSSQESLREAVRDIIRGEGQKLTQCFDSELNEQDIPSESSLKIIVVEAPCEEAQVAQDPAPATKQKPKIDSKETLSRIKAFFAKCFTRAWLDRLVKKMSHSSEVEGSPCIDEIIEDMEGLLLKGEEAEQVEEGGIDICPYERIQNVSPEQLLVFSEELSDLIYEHITSELSPLSPRPTSSQGITTICVLDRAKFDMYADLQSRVCQFLMLMSWWLNTQAASHSSIVIRAIEDIEVMSQTSLTQSEMMRVNTERLQTERCKMTVLILIEKLVSRLFRKAKLMWTLNEPTDIIRHLFEATWAAVQDADLCLNPEEICKLDKIIHKMLCEKWGSSEQVLIAIYMNISEVSDFIVHALKHQVTQPSSGSVLGRFFSAVGDVLCRPFRSHI